MNQKCLDNTYKQGYILVPWIPYFKIDPVILDDFKRKYGGLKSFIDSHNPGYRRWKALKPVAFDTTLYGKL